MSDELCGACEGTGSIVSPPDRALAEQLGAEFVGKVCPWCRGRGHDEDDEPIDTATKGAE